MFNFIEFLLIIYIPSLYLHVFFNYELYCPEIKYLYLYIYLYSGTNSMIKLK